MSQEEKISKTEKPDNKSTLDDQSSSSSENTTQQPKIKIVESAMLKSKSASKTLEEAEAAVQLALEKAKIAREEAEAAAEEEYKGNCS